MATALTASNPSDSGTLIESGKRCSRGATTSMTTIAKVDRSV